MSPTRSARIPVRTRPSRNAAPTDVDIETATFAKALGHPVRVAILKLLRHGECICGDIVDVLPLAQATVSQHLKVLKDAGLIRGEIDGPRVCYCIDPTAMKRLQALIGEL